MIINWFQLLSAIILLLTPIGLFHGPKVRYRAIRREWNGHWRQIFTLGQHTADAARAALGAWLLVLAFIPSELSANPSWTAPAAQTAILFAAILLQMLVCKESKSINAPYAFLIGLLFGLQSPATAVFATLFAVVLAGGARMPMAFFPALTLLSIGFGTVFTSFKHNPTLLIGACVILTPWLWSMLFSRALVITYRAKRAT